MASEEAPSLVDLPDPCLLAVLRCCADDQRSLFSAARAHSRLHQAAVVALHSVTAVNLRRGTGQQLVDSLLLYLQQHGQHVDSVRLQRFADNSFIIRELPPALQLTTLQLESLGLQLRQGDGSRGMLEAFGMSALKQLQLFDCRVLDAGPEELAAALMQLPPGLEHLSIRDVCLGVDSDVRGSDESGSDGSGSDSDINIFSDSSGDVEDLLPFITGALPRLQQLTFLELVVHDADARSPALRPLQALTRLVHLRLRAYVLVTAEVLSGMQQLTRLDLVDCSYEPDVLAGKTRLQHLDTCLCDVVGAGGKVHLLSCLQQLQKLTCLSIFDSSRAVEEADAPAAAYSAMTTSSKLQELSLRNFTVPAGAWQHIFPAGRQLPHLRSLNISEAVRPVDGYAPLPESSRLVSCCPGLQRLSMMDMQYSADFLASLQGLSELAALHLTHHRRVQGGLQAVCQLTGLKELRVDLPDTTDQQVLLQFTALRQLTMLVCRLQRTDGHHQDQYPIPYSSFVSKAPGDQPVWRLLQSLQVKSSGPGEAQQVDTAPAE